MGKLQEELRETEAELEVVGRELEKERVLGGEMKADMLVLLKKN